MKNKSPRIFAYYLPQFHSFKENDEWWGKGFTEWTNVGKAKPLFKGHDQPRVPTELGYYNLKMPEIREAQAQMAREAGVEGFIYWHYWFGDGKTLMADIFADVLSSGKPDFPFALAWANHSWFAKGWSSDAVHDKRLLMEQKYPGEEDARLFFDSMLPAFKDQRYIKVHGKPLFLIFDPDNLPDSYIHLLDKFAKESGFDGLYLIANVIKHTKSKQEYLDRGFNAVTYQRLTGATPKIASANRWTSALYKQLLKLRGWMIKRPPRLSDYSKCYNTLITEEERERTVIPEIVPQWDHTPRSGWNGSLFINSEPEYFKRHALQAFDTLINKPNDERIVILKSWNEWGEGNYMEPDITHGRGYITALKEALEEWAKDDNT